MKRVGTVYLVGAGPGDEGLLTLRAAELISRADVLFFDALVNPAILRHAPRTAEIIYAGKRSRDHAIPQEDLNNLLVAKAKEGKTVVRLKGGDPYVFGRGGEEAQELAAAGVPFEVVPAVSSVVAAPAYAGIPLTHREHCSSFTVVTGHEDPTKPGSSMDYAALAKIPGTKVVLMGVERIGTIAAELIQHGMAGGTPVALVRWGTTGRQETLVATLATVKAEVEKKKFTAPAVTIIGTVVNLRKELNWFEQRPLFGKRVVVTRTRTQASELSSKLSELGADVLEVPTIKIVPADDLLPLKDAILSLHEYNWIIFTSPNGVTAFFDYFFKGFDDLRDIGGVRFAAVGPATAAKLKELHIKVDVMPEQYVAGKIADAIHAYESLDNLRVLILRAQVASEELPEKLEELEAIVDDVACYKTIPETEDENGAAARLVEEGADWLTFSSSSTVENFHARFDLPALLAKFPKMKTLSIGPETSKAFEALGLKPSRVAKKHSIEGMVEELLR